VAVLGATHLLHEQVAHVRAGPLPTLALPEQLGRWQAAGDDFTGWAPAYRNASVVATTRYRLQAGGSDDTVGVWAALYRDQGYKRKMITSTNVLVEDGSLAWLSVAQPSERVEVDGRAVEFRAALLRTPADPKTRPTQRLLVWRVYQIGGRFVADDARAMLWLSLQRLLGRGDDSAVLFFYTVAAEGGTGERERLQAFVKQLLLPLAGRIEAASATTQAGPTPALAR
jgi:EpsI family protein